MDQDDQRLMMMFLNNSPIPMWIARSEGIIIRANSALYKALDRKPEQIIERYNFFEDENLKQPGIIEKIRDLRQNKHQVRFQLMWKADRAETGDFQDSVDRFIDVSIYPQLDGKGEVSHFICQWIDLTERMLSENRLLQSEASLLEYQELARLGNWELDVPTGLISWSDEVFRIFDRPCPDEGLTFDSFMTFVHPDDHSIIDNLYETLATKGTDQFQYRAIRPDGDIRWISGKGRTSFDEKGQPVRMYGVLQDITELKRVEMISLRSQERYQSLFDNSPVPLWEEDFSVVKKKIDLLRSEGIRDFKSYFDSHPEKIREYSKLVRIIDMNRAVLQLHEARSKEDIFDGLSCIFTEESYDGFKQELIAIGEEKGECSFEGSVITLMGKKKDIALKWMVVPGFEDSLRRVYISTLDITERKKGEAERERLMMAIGQAGEAIVITDNKAIIQYTNPSFEETTGYSADEVLGKNISLLKSGEQNDAFYREMWDALTNGKTWKGNLTNRKKDGSLFTEEAVISPVRDSSGETINYVAVKRNMTNEINLENQLHQAQKMEAVGRLAGGVAHDFNNMLAVILGNAEMLISEISPDNPFHEDITEIKKAAVRSTDLTRQLLAFARKQTVTPKVIDLNETVKSMMKMLKRLIGEDIEISNIPGEPIWPVFIDPSQIDQMLANLCVNAKDAIGGIGRVSIETGKAVFDEDFCRAHNGFQPGEYVLLAVSDNGCGMEPEVKESIFEPFFTTKKLGKGTGLGLATVYGAVKQNRGFINVYSEPGIGTTFKIYLPRHLGADSALLKEIEPLFQDEPRDEVILIVEDEEQVLNIAEKVLVAQGFEVILSHSPEDALLWADDYDGPIHLLITDVVMPGMNGRDLSRQFISRYPDLKCLYMSGYTADVIAHHGVLEAGINFIQKPFTRSELIHKVHRVLDSPKEPE